MLCTAKYTFSYAPESLFVVSNVYEPDTNIMVGKKASTQTTSDF